MAANTRNPSIRCQISGGPARRWLIARPAAPSRRLSSNSRTRSGSMPSRSTRKKMGRAACESSHAKNEATALAAGVSQTPIRSNTPPSTLRITAVAIAPTNAPVAMSARRIQAARTRSSSSPAPPEVHTVLARLASAATKNSGTNSSSGPRHSSVAPAASNTSSPSASANHPTSAWIGTRQSRSASVTSRNDTSRHTRTENTIRFRSPCPSQIPATTASMAAPNATLREARNRHASSAPPTYAATNGTASATTPILNPRASVRTSHTGRTRTPASASAASPHARSSLASGGVVPTQPEAITRPPPSGSRRRPSERLERREVDHVAPAPAEHLHLMRQRRAGSRRDHDDGGSADQPPADLAQHGRQVAGRLVRHAGEGREQRRLVAGRVRGPHAQRSAAAAQVRVRDQARAPTRVDRLAGEVRRPADRLLRGIGVDGVPERFTVRDVEGEQDLGRARRLVALRLELARVGGEAPVHVVHRVAGLVVANAREVLPVLEQLRGGRRRTERQPSRDAVRDPDAGLGHHEQRPVRRRLVPDRGEVERIGDHDVDPLEPGHAARGDHDGQAELHLGAPRDREASSVAAERGGVGVRIGQEAEGIAEQQTDDREGKALLVRDPDAQRDVLAHERPRRFERDLDAHAAERRAGPQRRRDRDRGDRRRP